MQTVNVSGLKNYPSEALRKAHRDLVVVMNRDRPDALIVGVGLAGVLDAKGVKPVLATALFRDGHPSLARAAQLAEMALGDFAAHLSRLGIAVVKLGRSCRIGACATRRQSSRPRPQRRQAPRPSLTSMKATPRASGSPWPTRVPASC